MIDNIVWSAMEAMKVRPLIDTSDLRLRFADALRLLVILPFLLATALNGQGDTPSGSEPTTTQIKKAFLRQARESATAGEEYVAADVAVAPLRIAGMGAKPDPIYARFLSSHLPDPEQAVAGWAKELAAGGLLLLEEVDSISTQVAPVR